MTALLTRATATRGKEKALETHNRNHPDTHSKSFGAHFRSTRFPTKPSVHACGPATTAHVTRRFEDSFNTLDVVLPTGDTK